MEQDMTRGNPLSVIFMFTLPLAVGNIFQQLYNMADTIIVGRFVGADALAAVGSTGTIMFLLNGFAQGITAGFSVLTAQRFGAGKKEGVKESVTNGVLLSIIGAILFTVLSCRIMNPLLHLMNTPDDIFDKAYTYIILISLGMALQFAITSSGTMIMQSAINLFGSEAVAAYTAACKVHSLLTQGMVAMGQTMAVYSGQNYGKGDAKRIRDGVKAALLIDVIYSVVSAVLVSLLLGVTLGLFFSGDVDLTVMMPWARTYITICTLFYIPLSTIFIFRNTMQGCGYGFLPMMGGVVELVARLSVAMIAMRVHSYALSCFCDPAAWLSAGLFTGVSYLFVMKKIRASLEPKSVTVQP